MFVKFIGVFVNSEKKKGVRGFKEEQLVFLFFEGEETKIFGKTHCVMINIKYLNISTKYIKYSY
jgi:hypothetical protein